MKQGSFKGIISILIALFLLSWLISMVMGRMMDEELYSGNVAIIPIDGFISFSKPLGISSNVDPHATVEKIKKAAAAPNIKAIVLDINSGGGTPVASETIVNAVKAVNKTTVAIIRDLGASGAYWIASSASTIIASKYSMTGSVGVRGSFIDYSGLLQRYNMSYERLVGGELKDIGDPFRPVSEAEKAMLQDRIDTMHKLFVADIKANRKLGSSQAAQISTGNFYLGQEAKKLGLIDIIGGDAELHKFLKEKLNTTEISPVTLTEKISIWDRLPSLFAKNPLQLNSGISLT